MRHRSTSRGAALGAALLALALGAGLGTLPTRAGSVAEYQAKAAFLYNFTKFVQWPESAFSGPKAPLVIAVLGADPFGSSLTSAVAGKSLDGHPLKVVHLSATSTVDAGTCQILFISSSEKERLGSILSGLAGQSVLTVADTERFAQKGGMIQFDQEGSKIALVVNLGAAQKSRLTISSKLLQVAKVLK